MSYNYKVEKQHINPLAPVNHPHSDDQVFFPIKPNNLRQEKRASKCFVYVFAVAVIFLATILVFSLMIRANSPRARLDLLITTNLLYGNGFVPYFNVSLATELMIKNANFSLFKFENTTVSILYAGVVVGEAKLGMGVVKARCTRRINIVVDARSNGLQLDGKNLTGDLSSGVLELSSYAKLSGRVHLIKFVKKRTVVMNCTMNLHLTSSLVEDLQCT